MHEIITLQLGQRSNYLATHFWNTQESYFTYSEQQDSLVNHDIHFRAGLGSDGSETFTPRTIIYDLKGGFGSLRKINALYDVEDNSGPIRGLWDGIPDPQQQQAIPPSRYQSLLEQGLPTFQLHESDVRYWSDFNRVYYHPRSAVQLNEYELNSQIMPFENWTTGQDLFRNLDKEFDLLDRDVRPFAEECDQMQGFQLITGADDAWGGFASDYLDGLRDEYGKASIWVWGVEDGTRAARQKQLTRSANAARSLRALGQRASAYIRLATPPAHLPNYVSLSSSSEWLNSALVCTAFESSTLPTRLTKSNTRPVTLGLLEDILNTNGNQNLFELQLSVKQNDYVVGLTPASDDDRSAKVSSAAKVDVQATSFDLIFSPGQENSQSRSQHVFAQVESDRHRRDGAELGTALLDPDERMRRRLNEETVVDRYPSELPFPLLDTFPSTLFRVPHDGRLLEVSAGLTTRSKVKDSILQLRSDVIRLVDVEEREVLYDDLTTMASGYSFGWDSGSDSGNDES